MRRSAGRCLSARLCQCYFFSFAHAFSVGYITGSLMVARLDAKLRQWDSANNNLWARENFPEFTTHNRRCAPISLLWPPKKYYAVDICSDAKACDILHRHRSPKINNETRLHEKVLTVRRLVSITSTDSGCDRRRRGRQQPVRIGISQGATSQWRILPSRRSVVGLEIVERPSRKTTWRSEGE